MAKTRVMTSPRSTAELAERMRQFTRPTIDYSRNLYFPIHLPREITDQGFDFVVAPAVGNGRIRLQCSGAFESIPDGTRIRVHLRPHRENLLLFGLITVPFGLVMLWGFWPINPTLAIGSVVIIESGVVAYLCVSAWASTRWVRRQLEAVLSPSGTGAEPKAAPSP